MELEYVLALTAGSASFAAGCKGGATFR